MESVATHYREHVSRAQLEKELKEEDGRSGTTEGMDYGGCSFRGEHLGDRKEYPPLKALPLSGLLLTNSDLTGSNLNGCELVGTDLKAAVLRDAILNRAILRGAHLEGADLSGAKLVDADLEGAFLTAADLTGVDFRGARLHQTRLDRRSLGKEVIQERDHKFDEAKLVYIALKKCFQSTGAYGDASWSYGRERRMGKKMNNPWRARQYYGAELTDEARQKWGFHARHTAKWVADWFVELLCDYGESIWRVACWLGVLWFVAAIGFWRSRALVGPNGELVTSFVDCLAYSLGGLTTTSFEHLQPRTVVEWMPFATAMEALLGIALTGLLGFVLGNRIGRA